MEKDYLPKGMTKEKMENMSDESKKILSRARGGIPPQEHEVQKLADDMASGGGRPMFGSSKLQRELYKIKNSR